MVLQPNTESTSVKDDDVNAILLPGSPESPIRINSKGKLNIKSTQTKLTSRTGATVRAFEPACVVSTPALDRKSQHFNCMFNRTANMQTYVQSAELCCITTTAQPQSIHYSVTSWIFYNKADKSWPVNKSRRTRSVSL